MIYDTKAVTVEEWSQSADSLIAEGWERTPDPKNPEHPLLPVGGVIYLRKEFNNG